eukprot:365567-Chlamydomonas_euryale.AAC.6
MLGQPTPTHHVSSEPPHTSVAPSSRRPMYKLSASSLLAPPRLRRPPLGPQQLGDGLRRRAADDYACATWQKRRGGKAVRSPL